MRDIAIKVENLGKKYIIRHEKQEPYKTFQDILVNSGKKIITSLNPFTEHQEQDETIEEFWALRDVSFEINKGDKVGIIGRNGAGKSTLLKVLSRITEPTTGKIHINGRIASLLEVGTGFHPELTGRENIYLNGAILGMSRAEIKAKFDEIVAFAEVEKFLDTPVKRYSSGMYVRLAFSVAAHLEPEILVVDEVLAVGDVEFQKKCLGKMKDVSEEGRTIVFVSHNIDALVNLCTKGILLKKGKLVQAGTIDEAISYYLHNDVEKLDLIEGKNFSMKIEIGDENIVQMGKNLLVKVFFTNVLNPGKYDFAAGIIDGRGKRIVTFSTKYELNSPIYIEEKSNIKIIWIQNILLPGIYYLSLAIYDKDKMLDGWNFESRFEIRFRDIYHTGKIPDSSCQGDIFPLSKWIINKEEK